MNDAARQRWEQIEALLHEALDLPGTARAGFLQRACGRDAALRRELESLLAGAEAGERLLEPGIGLGSGTPKPQHVTELQPGTLLGAWRVLRLIGRGGMGEVYLAERADGQFEQQVAIKLLRAEAAEHLDRFQAERQILARLQHPGIARLLDAGVGIDGRPFMVMEFVAGVPLTEYCREHRLSLAARLALFEQVCDAVSFAHANLIVHRDLKSGNILVGADGRVKLLDFGIAKLLDPASWSGQDLTVTRAAPLTPDHAAPEQLLGEPVTIATDVYALGIVLYELLTGRSPWAALRNLAISIALYRILRDDPEPPSRAAQHDGAPVPPRLLRGDLDAIVAKALRKTPSARYAAVQDLRADLGAWMRGEPVSAGPDSAWYRISKFARRYRVALVVASAFLIMLAGFTWRLANERDRALAAERHALREAQASQQVTDYLVSLFRAASPQQAGGKPIEPRALVDAGRRQLDERLLEQPALRGRMLGTIGQLYSELGVIPDAIASLEAALALHRELPDADPVQTAQYLFDLGEAHSKIRQFDAAERVYTESLALRRERLPPADTRIAATLLGLGSALEQNGKQTEGLAALERAHAMLRNAGGSYSAELARAALALGVAKQRANRLDEARRLVEEAVRELREQQDVAGLDYIEALTTYGRLLWEQGDNAAAEIALRDALQAALPIYGGDSVTVTTLQSTLASVLSALGRLREAIALGRPLIEVAQRVSGPDSADLALNLVNLSIDLMMVEEYDEALRHMKEALDIYGSPVTAPASLDAYQAWLLYASALSSLSRFDEALQILQHAPPAEWEGGYADGLRGARFVYLGDSYHRRGSLDQAAQAYQDAEAFLGDKAYAMLRHRRAALLAEQGEHSRALPELRAVLAQRIESQGPAAIGSLKLKLEVAESLAALGQTAEAETLLREVTPLIERELGPDSRTRKRLAKLRNVLQRPG